MSEQKPTLTKFHLLESVLAQTGLPLKGIYTNRDAAEIFGVSVRAIQDRVKNGELVSRNLPGHGRFLSEDLEDFLRNSTRSQAAGTKRNDR